MNFTPIEKSGFLFANENKKSDKSPNAGGTAMINGVLYYISAWTRTGAKGKYQSLSFKEVNQKGNDQGSAEKAESHKSDDVGVDDIPF